MNVQEATAKALLVDADALLAAQTAGDVLGANGIVMDAYNTDVRPLLAELREQQGGLDPRPPACVPGVGLRGEDRRRSCRREPGGMGGSMSGHEHGRRAGHPVEPVGGPTRGTPTTRAATRRPRALRRTR